MATLSDLYIIAAGLDHPEAVNLGPDGELYTGGEAGQIYRLDMERRTGLQLATTDGFVAGVCLDGAGAIYACTIGDIPAVHRVEPERGEVGVWCDSADGGPLETPNYASFAADGTLWFTDSGTEAIDVVNGRLIRVPPGGGDGQVVNLGMPLHYSNGMCIDGDGLPCFLETLTPRLSRLRDDSVEVIAEFPDHSPDGVVACSDGGFLIGMYYPYRIAYVPPTGGTFEILLDDPAGIHIPMPTNLCFYGPRLDRLAIASLGGSIIKGIDLGITGLPLHYPE